MLCLPATEHEEAGSWHSKSLAGTARTAGVTLLNAAGHRMIDLQAGTAAIKMGGRGQDGDITLFPSTAKDIATPAQATIHLDGEKGDIILKNADAAEEFDIVGGQPLDPGHVMSSITMVAMVLDHDGRLVLSDRQYDRRVAGVVAGSWRPSAGHRLLDQQAAWPIGLIYGNKPLLWDQRQVLAIGYTDNGAGQGTLRIWDNEDGNRPDTMQLDFRGNELEVTGCNPTVEGFFHERYMPQRPPQGL
jgi:hypothetical protein